MPNPTISKADLIAEAARDAGVTQTVMANCYDALVKNLTKSFVDGKGHLVMGFANFKPEVREARTGRNPQTGETIQIPAKRTLKVVVSDILLEHMNNPKEFRKKEQEAAKSKK